MLITGVQKVLPACPEFINALPSLASWLPVADHRDRLKEHEVRMGKAVFEASGSVLEYRTPGPEIPCVASLHH
jgi:hypothetical protein